MKKSIFIYVLIIMFVLFGGISVAKADDDNSGKSSLRERIDRALNRDSDDEREEEEEDDGDEDEDNDSDEDEDEDEDDDSDDDKKNRRMDSIRDLRERASSTKNSTTTRQNLAERTQKSKTMKMEAFKIRQTALVRQLRISIGVLESIEARLAQRIEIAESRGRNMDEAKERLEEAGEAIDNAKMEIEEFASWTHSTSTASTTNATSTDIDLEKPRGVAEDAIEAVKEAKDLLKEVIRLIAHNMGLGQGGNDDEDEDDDNATSTATTTNSTATTTNNTATTTNNTATTTDSTSTTTATTTNQ
jgi:hypothetical protein